MEINNGNSSGQTNQFVTLKLEQLDSNPFYTLVRTEIDQQQWRQSPLFAHLVKSFEAGEMAHFALLVRAKPGHSSSYHTAASHQQRYELVHGHLRVDAARMAAYTALPAVVQAFSDEDMLRLLVRENYDQWPLSRVAMAGLVAYLRDELDWKVRQIADWFGDKTYREVFGLYQLSQAPRPHLEAVNQQASYSEAVREMVEYHLNPAQQAEILQLIASDSPSRTASTNVFKRVRQMKNQHKSAAIAKSSPISEQTTPEDGLD